MSSTRAPLIPDAGLSRRDFLRLTAAGAATAAVGLPAVTDVALQQRRGVIDRRAMARPHLP